MDDLFALAVALDVSPTALVTQRTGDDLAPASATALPGHLVEAEVHAWVLGALPYLNLPGLLTWWRHSIAVERARLPQLERRVDEAHEDLRTAAASGSRDEIRRATARLEAAELEVRMAEEWCAAAERRQQDLELRRVEGV